MGYAVGFSGDRWIGYGVPAECDQPDCSELIDRGMAYACSNLWVYDSEGYEVEADCSLYFCERHRYSHSDPGHENLVPKDEYPGWMLFQLTDESWAAWREENPHQVARYRKVLSDPTTLSLAQEFVDRERDNDVEGTEGTEGQDDEEEVQDR